MEETPQEIRKVQYVAVLVRDDVLEYVSDPNSDENPSPPAYLEDITHCPVCAREYSSLYTNYEPAEDYFVFNPVCHTCYSEGRTQP